MAEYLYVAGDEIYYGPHKVATLEPSLWATLRDEVEGLICGAGQPEEIKELERTINALEAELEQSDRDHNARARQLEEDVREADQRTEEFESILLEIGEDANCFATGRVLLAMQDKLRVAEQEIESLRKQLVDKPKKRK